MTRSELINVIINKLTNIPSTIIKEAVKQILDHMSITMAHGERIEIRGFGSFSLHYRAPRSCRNPKTGDQVNLKEKYVPYFKSGKKLRYLVNCYA